MTGKKYQVTRGRFSERYGFDSQDTPTDQQLLDALNAVEVERNRQLERIRNFGRKRIREKMRGKRYPSRKDVENLQNNTRD